MGINGFGHLSVSGFSRVPNAGSHDESRADAATHFLMIFTSSK